MMTPEEISQHDKRTTANHEAGHATLYATNYNYSMFGKLQINASSHRTCTQVAVDWSIGLKNCVAQHVLG